MLTFFTSKSVKRPNDILRNEYEVYDLTFLEWEQCVTVKSENNVYICTEKDKSGNKYFEVLYRKERFCVFSLYRANNLESVENIYNLVKRVFNQLGNGITSNKPLIVAPILKEIVRLLRAHPLWTIAHIAAKLGLERLFVSSNADITSNLNVRSQPDLLTPLHLVLQSGRTSVAKAVLALKPRIDLVDRKGNSALHFAAMSERDILIAMLKLANIKDLLYLKNIKGCTPLHLACFADKPLNVIEFLKSGFMSIQLLTILPPVKNKRLKSIEETNRDIIPSQPLIFSKDIIDDMDIEDMKYGGTPLHWTRHRRTLSILMDKGFDVNIVNINGETALHIMVKKLRLKCAIHLLCHNADVNAITNCGDSPLHYSVQKTDITITQLLVVFNGDINCVNNGKESVRHMASKSVNEEQKMILYLLNSVGAKRCEQNVYSMLNCSLGCAYNGKHNGERYHKWPLFDNESFYRPVLFEHILANRGNRSDRSEHKQKRERMMCFDGGGVRGLISIQMLIEMEKQLKYPISNYFEWIAGTSTGAIIAMLLSTGKTLTQIRDIYFKFKDQILIGSKPYSSSKFETLLHEIVSKDMLMSEVTNKYHKKLIITGTLVNRTPAQLHLFRSYESPQQICGMKEDTSDTDNHRFSPLPNCDQQLVWKACRASGAAPSYFRAHGPFLDGGLIANNPTLDALTEFRLYNNCLKSVGKRQQSSQLDFVVSFGTGRASIETAKIVDIDKFWSLNPRDTYKGAVYIKQMTTLLVNQITNTESHIVNRAMSWCSSISVPYFRLNPPISEHLPMDEKRDDEIINALYETKAYMYAMSHQISIITNLLNQSNIK